MSLESNQSGSNGRCPVLEANGCHPPGSLEHRLNDGLWIPICPFCGWINNTQLMLYINEYKAQQNEYKAPQQDRIKDPFFGAIGENQALSLADIPHQTEPVRGLLDELRSAKDDTDQTMHYDEIHQLRLVLKHQAQEIGRLKDMIREIKNILAIGDK